MSSARTIASCPSQDDEAFEEDAVRASAPPDREDLPAPKIHSRLAIAAAPPPGAAAPPRAISFDENAISFVEKRSRARARWRGAKHALSLTLALSKRRTHSQNISGPPTHWENFSGRSLRGAGPEVEEHRIAQCVHRGVRLFASGASAPYDAAQRAPPRR